MNEALIKTLVLLLLIAVGYMLKSKFNLKEKTDGIKEMVLSVALPSTIFIALMKIELNASMLFIPVITLLFNFFLYYITPLALASFGVQKNSATGRTFRLLVPSLAPGLSCFPFIVEFLGEDSLALAAMADVGNKFFVLIFLYVVALNMFLKNTEAKETNVKEKLKSLALNLVKEPINILLFVALALLSFGIHYDTLPVVIQGIFDKTSALMTPLVLLFIGLAVKLKQGNKKIVLSLLFFRAGISLVFTALGVIIFQVHSVSMILLATVIPLSAISFWPFAHISLFYSKEDQLNIPLEKRTFDLELAVMVLALSLPFSTVLILGILTAGDYFADTWRLGVLGAAMTGIGIIPLAFSRLYFRSRASEAKS